MTVRLGGDVRLKLIRLVKEHQVVYDPKHPQHSDKVYVDYVWSEIASQVGLRDGKEANKKWRYLKDSWRVQKKKKIAFPDGSVPIKWPYFDEMSFMDKYLCGSAIHFSNQYSMYSSLSDSYHHPMDALYQHSMMEQNGGNRSPSRRDDTSEDSRSMDECQAIVLPESPESPTVSEARMSLSNNVDDGKSPHSSNQAMDVALKTTQSKPEPKYVNASIQTVDAAVDPMSQEITKYCEYLSCRMGRLSKLKLHSLIYTIDTFFYEQDSHEKPN